MSRLQNTCDSVKLVEHCRSRRRLSAPPPHRGFASAGAKLNAPTKPTQVSADPNAKDGGPTVRSRGPGPWRQRPYATDASEQVESRP